MKDLQLLLPIIIASRPRQWVKNALLFAPLVFGGRLFSIDTVSVTVLGCISFCLLSSSNYILNDVLDAQSDRMHPFKKNRPIAKRTVETTQAVQWSLTLGLAGLLVAWYIGTPFFATAIAFVGMHYLYYFFFRFWRIADVLAVASVYVIRIWAGEMASDSHMSAWLFLAVLSFSLLVGIGKRRGELSFIQEYSGKIPQNIRKDFLYTERLIDSNVAVFASSTFITYTYFTFLTSPLHEGVLFRGYAPYIVTFLSRKWLMLTVPFVLYGLMRYLQLIYAPRKDSLSQALTKDVPLIVTLGLWMAVTLFVLYGIGG